MADSATPVDPLLFVFMGVSGSGKTSIGREVARRCALRFFEGDDYHSRENVAKMSAGISLTDADRLPWIATIARAINESEPRDSVLACSALNNVVRQQLIADVQRPCIFIHLRADPQVIRQRLLARTGHYMRSNMLDSQLAALELPADAFEIDVGRPFDRVVDEVMQIVTRQRTAVRASPGPDGHS
jgi:gluconokinase